MDRCAFFPVTCLRGIAGFQVLLASWGKGHRQAVFTPVAQQVCCGIKKDSGGGSVSLPDCSDCSLQMF